MRTQRPLSKRQATALTEIAAKHGVTFAALLGKNNFRIIHDARRACCAWLRDEGWSYPEIGGAMNRDHSSVMYILEPELKREQMRAYALKQRQERRMGGVR